MEKSQFSQYIDKWLKPIALYLTKTINGKETPETYLYKLMLTKKFSPTMKWESIGIDGRTVMADVVATDSQLPLKKRSLIKRLTGSIPKIGMKKSMNETQMDEISLLESLATAGNTYEMEIVDIVFDDARSVVKGVFERLEYMFLQALSNDGVFQTEDDENVGILIRVDLEMPEDQKFGVVTPWSDPAAKPIDDLTRVISAAKRKGKVLSFIHMDYSTFTALLSNTQIKRQLAASQGYGSVANDGLADALPEQLTNLMRTQYKLTINVIDRSVIAEIDGVDTVINCWTENKVVLTTGMNVGNLVWSRLAAERRPNKAFDYAKIDDYTLLSIYQTMDDTPLEYTTSQARVLPVLNMMNIYSINTEEASIAAQTEGDTTITLFGDSTVVKADAITALKSLGVTINANATDATVQKKVNELNAEDEQAFKTALDIA